MISAARTPRQLARSMASAGVKTLLALAGWVSFASAAHAVPAFAVQTGQACASCHVGGYGPQLTAFGRDFKMRGYTLRAGNANAPFSAMAVASFLHTAQDQAEAPAPGYHRNDNLNFDEASLFVAGGSGHFGGFAQIATYDAVGHAWSWDNIDMRAVTDTTLAGAPVVLGLSLNNSPGVQDPWNSLAVWGFPYTDSGLAPAPEAAPAIADAFAGNTIGLTGYAWWNSALYTEFGLYSSPGASFLDDVGVDPADTNELKDSAPYARIAYQHPIGPGSLEIGAFGFWADYYPGRDHSADAVDRVRDLGLDASYEQSVGDGASFTFNARYTHEQRDLSASQALEGSEKDTGTLQDARADVSYYFPNNVGLTAQAFKTWGSADEGLYADNRTFKPDSSGVMLQVDATPFGGSDSPFGPRFNLRVGAQFIHYATFNGADKNYDGAGTDAADNDTLRIFTWFAY